MGELFAGAGSCFSPIKVIQGTVNGITFTSKEFTGTMDSRKFWDDLSALAKKTGYYIELRY